MKDILQDIVAHVHALGYIPLIKVTSDENETNIFGKSEDGQSVVLYATTKNPVKEFDGIFGMPNMGKLDIHLKCPEYKEDAKISVLSTVKNDEVHPTGLHFENVNGDFQNDYRFMTKPIVNEKLKSSKFNGANWNIEFAPSTASIQRLKFQQAANTEETLFQVSTDNDNLVFSFGDSNTHAGSFVFQSGIQGKLRNAWCWPISYTMSILTLPGDIEMKISDTDGAMMITVDSGLAVYQYILSAYTK
jgi:hypothetical protein